MPHQLHGFNVQHPVSEVQEGPILIHRLHLLDRKAKSRHVLLVVLRLPSIRNRLMQDVPQYTGNLQVLQRQPEPVAMVGTEVGPCNEAKLNAPQATPHEQIGVKD
ncbi:hypothetical protein D3C71_1547400 [compost metagenome]